MKKSSCQGCEKRTLGCHSTCEDYKAYSEALRQKRHIEWKKHVDEGTADGYIKKQIPMKATYSSPLWYICPKCSGSISIENIQEHIHDVDTTYCEHCGQAID